MKPKALDHFVCIVSDLEEAAATWKDVFGLEIGQRVEPGVLQARLGLLDVGGGSSGSSLVELCNPLSEGPLSQLLETDGPGMLSVSVEVDDIDGTVAGLRSGGVVVSDVVPGPLPNTRVARFSPDVTNGVRLQLLERSSDA